MRLLMSYALSFKVLDCRFEVPPVALLASCVVVKRTAWPSHPLLGSLVPVIEPLLG